MSDEVVENVEKEVPKKAPVKKAAVKAVATQPVADVSSEEVEAIQEAVQESISREEPLTLTPNTGVVTLVANGTSWTVTTTVATGLNAGQSVLLQGFTPAAFNGQYTIASITSSTVFVISNTTQNGVTPTVYGSVEAAYPYNTSIQGNFNMWSPWVTLQNGDLLSYNSSVNTKDWAGAVVFQNGQYNTTQRGF